VRIVKNVYIKTDDVRINRMNMMFPEDLREDFTLKYYDTIRAQCKEKQSL